MRRIRCDRAESDDDILSRLARADGGDAHAGAVHRPRVDLRAQARRHPPARVQARRRRAPVLAQPAAAEHATRRRRGDRGAAGARRDPRRRSDWRGARAARSTTTCSTSSGSTAATSRRCRSTSAARCSSELPLRAAAAARRSRSTSAQPWERACAEGWEGVIAKRRDSPYEHRRSPHWLKMKCEATQELVVGGFTDPQGSARRPRRAAGRLLRGRRLRLRRQGRHRLRHEAAARPARAARRARDPEAAVHAGRWACRACARTGCVRRSSCRSAFIEWTVHGKLRHPRLLGVRYDKARARRRHGSSRDHPSREGAVPGRRHHARASSPPTTRRSRR